MAQRVNRTPAIVVSILLHAAIIGASLVAWPWKKEIKPLAVTPVTLLTSDQLAALSAAEQSDEPTPARRSVPSISGTPSNASISSGCSSWYTCSKATIASVDGKRAANSDAVMLMKPRSSPGSGSTPAKRSIVSR